MELTLLPAGGEIGKEVNGDRVVWRQVAEALGREEVENSLF